MNQHACSPGCTWLVNLTDKLWRMTLGRRASDGDLGVGVFSSSRVLMDVHVGNSSASCHEARWRKGGRTRWGGGGGLFLDGGRGLIYLYGITLLTESISNHCD